MDNYLHVKIAMVDIW